MAINNANLVQQCFEQLENDIITNVLVPGEKLRIEMLKKRFGVGQSPLREALSRLVASGLVTVKHNKGFYVAPISENDIRDIYETFNLIENLTLQKSLEHGDDRWAATIVASLYELSLAETQKKIIDSKTWQERNYAFHLALVSGCNSPALLQIRNELYKRFDRYCHMSFSVMKHSLEHNHKAHQELADAALKRDATKACNVMNAHICGSLENVVQALKNHKLL